MSNKWTESFYVGDKTAAATVFQLSLENLDTTPVTAKVLQADGSFVDKVETTDFTVNRTSGTVTFVAAPGKSPLEGADNVYITASKDRSESRSRITNCDTCIVYGETGTRLFVTGDPNFKNRDFWSAQNDFPIFRSILFDTGRGQRAHCRLFHRWRQDSGPQERNHRRGVCAHRLHGNGDR